MTNLTKKGFIGQNRTNKDRSFWKEKLLLEVQKMMDMDKIMTLPLDEAMMHLNKSKGMKFHESLSLYRLWQSEKIKQVQREVGILGR
jgi:hypothetical protein